MLKQGILTMKRNIVAAVLMTMGAFISLEAVSIAQPSPPATKPSPGAQLNQTSLSPVDKQFITEAAQGGMAEVQLAELALKRASSSEVKKYAQQMISDHTKANKELMAIASKKGVTPPKTIGPQFEAVRAKLSKLSGTSFDQAYINEAGVKAHTQQEALFRQQSQQGQDPQLKAFATKTLPIVQGHLQMAEKMTGNTPTSPSASPSPSVSPSP